MRLRVEPHDPSYPHIGPILDEAEAETYEICRAIFALRGTCLIGFDGTYRNEAGQRVMIRVIDGAMAITLTKTPL